MTNVQIDTARKSIQGIKTTSGIIRILYNQVTGDHKVSQVEKLLKVLGVTTVQGEPIRYQHVRNVLTQTIGSKL